VVDEAGTTSGLMCRWVGPGGPLRDSNTAPMTPRDKVGIDGRVPLLWVPEPASSCGRFVAFATRWAVRSHCDAHDGSEDNKCVAGGHGPGTIDIAETDKAGAESRGSP
jgi:hypothetical protein